MQEQCENDENKVMTMYYSIPCLMSVLASDCTGKPIRDLSVEIERENISVFDNDEAALKRLLRLNQIASNPRLIDESYSCQSGKEVVLDFLLEDICNSDDKCIVWSSFVHNIDYFEDHYSKYNPVKVHGKMAIKYRNLSIKKFLDDDSCKVLFATPQAAKEGLTLTVANHAIFYDRGFSLDDYLQAQDRIHRISQTKTCFIHNIMLRGSIDEWIDALLSAKHNAAMLAQGDINRDSYAKLADYSYGEMIKEILEAGDIK